MQGLQEAVMQLAVVVITGLVSVLTAKATAYFREKGLLAKLDAKKKSVDIAVNAVEQIYYEEEGPERYKQARTRAIDLLNKQGITITEQELDTLIEAAVSGMKQGYDLER
ncbi:phage holin, LLH family [Vagococcus lutrae]|uniref:phage holin, LLH family n=1 Tax=Vagococcus lutrae TaxID=81947 RepID=UPI00288CC918|nr:phage holin, LLH family [Vagococcus lutrae]MDT2824862.1 phage holin, LLH family [Vagococcus lutrae]